MLLRLILKLFILIPVALLALCLVIGNPEPVTLTLWPLSFAVTLPLFVPLLALLGGGILLGAFWLWCLELPQHWQSWRLAKEVARLESELSKQPLSNQSRLP